MYFLKRGSPGPFTNPAASTTSAPSAYSAPNSSSYTFPGYPITYTTASPTDIVVQSTPAQHASHKLQPFSAPVFLDKKSSTNTRTPPRLQKKDVASAAHQQALQQAPQQAPVSTIQQAPVQAPVQALQQAPTSGHPPMTQYHRVPTQIKICIWEQTFTVIIQYNVQGYFEPRERISHGLPREVWTWDFSAPKRGAFSIIMSNIMLVVESANIFQPGNPDNFQLDYIPVKFLEAVENDINLTLRCMVRGQLPVHKKEKMSQAVRKSPALIAAQSPAPIVAQAAAPVVAQTAAYKPWTTPPMIYDNSSAETSGDSSDSSSDDRIRSSKTSPPLSNPYTEPTLVIQRAHSETSKRKKFDLSRPGIVLTGNGIDIQVHNFHK